jgi:hypothetical protein
LVDAYAVVEEAQLIAYDDRRINILSLTSTGVTCDGWLITRLPASGVGIRFPRGTPKAQVTALSL